MFIFILQNVYKLGYAMISFLGLKINTFTKRGAKILGGS